uniref:BZIP domain-containing protein n=1 Tax=Steinernema glaseri TaxID=37863 RepID=A0A1I7YJN4_9BILA
MDLKNEERRKNTELSRIIRTSRIGQRKRKETKASTTHIKAKFTASSFHYFVLELCGGVVLRFSDFELHRTPYVLDKL